MVMKKLTLVFLVSLMTVFSYGQNKDGIVYWSSEAGYQFDFDLDGKIDLTVPTQTKDVAISEVFVYDANGDGYFDLCEVDRSCSVDQLIHWKFYYNDGNNNFVDPQDIIYGMAVGDKALTADFNGDGIGDVAIRRDNEYGLWWLMHFFLEDVADVNLAFGITDTDALLAGDMNNDGLADVVLYDKGAWLCSFTPSTTEHKVPDFANQDIANMQFGTKNDIPVLLDVDGDGYDDMALCSVNDEEVSVNLHSADKPENNGYSKSGRGSFDLTFDMPSGINPTCVRGVKIGKGTVNGINAMKQDGSVSVYPTIIAENTSFTVKTASDNANISVYNVMGQLIKAVSADKDVTVQAEGWSKGNYYVRVESGNNIVTKKLIVR